MTKTAHLKDTGAESESSSKEAILDSSNRCVHGLWIGASLSKMELLTIRSFIRHGHEFNLWLYNDLETPLPDEVILRDANEIIPHHMIIQKAGIDRESGVGEGSFSSPFSDLFRFKLLFDKGGFWVDMDVTCLKPFHFTEPYVFRSHRIGVVGNIMKCPRHSDLMDETHKSVKRLADPHSEWLMPNRVLSEMVRRFGLTSYIRSGLWNDDVWWRQVYPLAFSEVPVPSEWVAIHWINEVWRTLKQTGGMYRGRRIEDGAPDKEHPRSGSALDKLYIEYGLSPEFN